MPAAMDTPQSNRASGSGGSSGSQRSSSHSGGGSGRRSSRSRPAKLHRILDGVTEGLLHTMVVFAPWAFGTTEEKATWVMNIGGYLLGALLVTKWVARWRTEQRPARWDDDAGGSRWPVRVLVALTLLILSQCFISAWNARIDQRFSADNRDIYYLDCIKWLPHSYDQSATWFSFWSYLALACTFWAARDWLLGKTAAERREEAGEDSEGLLPAGAAWNARLPGRLRRLLWVFCVNGTLLGIEGILQRLEGSGKLLFLVRPHINQQALGQFGPYAYRSNAAQYFNLVWPLGLGLWWALRTRARVAVRKVARVGSGAHVMLPLMVVLMAACPIISTSRGGAAIAVLTLIAALLVLIIANRGSNWRSHLTIFLVFATVTGLAGYLGWSQLEARLNVKGEDVLSGRGFIYANARQMVKDFPVFGAGPGSFPMVYELYRTTPEQKWEAYLHDDWLQTRVEWGWVGFGLILSALLLVLSGSLRLRSGTMPPVLTVMIWLALGGCLAHAVYDFPLQVYSILFVFLLECAILLAHGGRLFRAKS